MEPLTLHMNHQHNHIWEWRDGGTVLLSFKHVGQGYSTDGGEPLGVRWDDAKAKSLDLAEKRRSRKILEKAR